LPRQNARCDGAGGLAGVAGNNIRDGHVESDLEAKLFDKGDTALRRWNNDNQPHLDKLTGP